MTLGGSLSEIVYGHSQAVAAWVAKRLGEEGFGRCQAIGFLDDFGVLEAGVVYHNWSPEAATIEITAASIHRKWGTRGRLRAIFAYPFDVVGCQLVVARTGERNLGPLRIWRALGADEYRIPRLFGRDEAAIITTLTVEQWRESRYHG